MATHIDFHFRYSISFSVSAFQVALIQQRLYTRLRGRFSVPFGLLPAASYFEIRAQKHPGPPIHVEKKKGPEDPVLRMRDPMVGISDYTCEFAEPSTSPQPARSRHTIISDPLTHPAIQYRQLHAVRSICPRFEYRIFGLNGKTSGNGGNRYRPHRCL